MTLGILFTAVCSDLKWGKIPNGWILVGLAAGLVLRAAGLIEPDWGIMFWGMILPILICWIPFRMRALGAGDVKLFIMIGCLNGGNELIYILFLSFLFAAGISLGRLLRLRQLIQSMYRVCHYIQDIFLQGKMQDYPGRSEKGHTIRFSIAVFLGYVAWLGVKFCRHMQYL